MAQLGMRLGARELDPARVAWLVRILASQDRKLMVAAWNEAMAFDSRSRLAEIACPTLIVAGSDDAGVPIHHAHMLHDGIRNSKLVVIEGARHTLIWTHADEFVWIVEEFLLDGPLDAQALDYSPRSRSRSASAYASKAARPRRVSAMEVRDALPLPVVSLVK
jgi:TAP-like protein